MSDQPPSKTPSTADLAGGEHSLASAQADEATRQQAVWSAATATNTRRAYRSAVRHYRQFEHGRLPATPDELCRYLLHHAESLRASTLALRLTALGQWHLTQGYADPAATPAVRKTLRGIERLYGQPARKARALSVADLQAMIVRLRGDNDLLALRDEALLSLAFFGALRRSELVALTVDRLRWEAHGLVFVLPRSKTDQEGHGITKAIPFGNDLPLCPPRALRRWLDAAGINDGPVFRAINRWGKLSPRPLAAGAINTILRSRARATGLVYAEELSSHSFRRGLATSAYQAGADLRDIKRQGGWRCDASVQGYIDEAELFMANAAGRLLNP